MLNIEDLAPTLSQEWLINGHAKLERNLLLFRLGLTPEEMDHKERGRLARFAQSVMAGASTWQDPRSGDARRLCQIAADIEAALFATRNGSSNHSHLSLVKAMILYELAGLPGASSTYATRNGFDARFRDFFTRSPSSIWAAALERDAFEDEADLGAPVSSGTLDQLLETALGELAQEAGLDLQNDGSAKSVAEVFRVLGELGSLYKLPLTGDDFHALGKLTKLRDENSVFRVIRDRSSISDLGARRISLPLELWPAQVEAIKRGLLNQKLQSFGFAAPTGTGKTSLTRLVIADSLAAAPDKKILYVCPSRALVHQVASDLTQSLAGISVRVIEVGAHLTVHDELPVSPDTADVMVFTPERADLLLRVNPDFLADVGLLIVDEAHHIEQPNRGVLLEFYLWRLRKMLPSTARIIQLSAVTPNISELTNWLAAEEKRDSLMVDWRSSRLRVGVLNRSSNGSAKLKFEAGAPYTVPSEERLPQAHKEGVAVLANHLSGQGTVLVLCTSPGMAEDIAQLIHSLRDREQDISDDISVQLDAWIERELYPECPLRTYYKRSVVYHHAKLPPRVRIGVEEAVKAKKVNVICATTTLAEGVNFPFSTVIVASLVGNNYQLTPRALWNIAGRAGRFGVDTEGHCIIYRPELWSHRLRDYQLSDYLKTNLADIPPVKSALATGIESLHDLVRAGQVDQKSLTSLNLSAIKVNNKNTNEAKRVRALLNIMRVGYAHASSSNLIDLSDLDAPEFDHGFLAASQLTGERMQYARELGAQQRWVVREATADNAEFVEIAAKVGWSLEAQTNIYNWLTKCQGWQLEQFGHFVVGGWLRTPENLGYLIGPLAKNLLAFEGEALGGFTSFVAQKWIEGVPLSQMENKDFNDLVSTIYGRIQYLLPWGLFGLHELLEYEARRRKMTVGTGVRDLSVLAAEGVPNFDALQLIMQLGIERVDATRLSKQFRGRAAETNITSWFASLSWAQVEHAVRGSDRRRVDPALAALHAKLQ